MHNISEIEELIKLISKLPGLGPKSAKRIVLKLINNRNELVKPMASTLAQVYKNVTRCNSCGSLKSNSNGCINCENIKEKQKNKKDELINEVKNLEIYKKVIEKFPDAELIDVKLNKKKEDKND